jgi:hypothetical protein
MPPSTGIKIGHGWVQAFYEGQPIAGLTFEQATKTEDRGKRWTYAAVTRHWGQQVADLVLAGGVIVE